MTDAAPTFTCCECGRFITVICGPADGILCLSCTMLPAWFRDPDLRHAIDRDHGGAEVLDDHPVPSGGLFA